MVGRTKVLSPADTFLRRDAMNGFYPECINASGYDRVSPLEESTSMAGGLFECSKEAHDQF